MVKLQLDKNENIYLHPKTLKKKRYLARIEPTTPCYQSRVTTTGATRYLSKNPLRIEQMIHSFSFLKV